MPEAPETAETSIAVDPATIQLLNELRQLEYHEKTGTLTGEMHQRLAVIREQLANVDQADTDTQEQPWSTEESTDPPTNAAAATSSPQHSSAASAAKPNAPTATEADAQADSPTSITRSPDRKAEQ